ncbi:hypothetical protein M4951_01380 [Blastopirellula sp. J2-11]|uniref:hypothetical protein n=1 Tax=Blastopirellula sp. J2-11 TaxID=2943192 RepID=UPI0021C7582F|nr:hypothetical protein [Blastopirellula sp. J2-11]UUO06977.1 hypothetical protein M4951_01380 [Blastopirellula sp. J2-11]
MKKNAGDPQQDASNNQNADAKQMRDDAPFACSYPIPVRTGKQEISQRNQGENWDPN